MRLSGRVVGAIGAVFLSVLAMLLIGSPVTSCLGPLGRTLVQSIADGCIKPGLAPATPVIGFLLSLAVLLLLPIDRDRYRFAALGAIIGSSVAALGCATVPPTTMTGPTSTGAIITVVLPFDWNLLLTAMIAGATIGLVVGSNLGRRSRISAVRALD